MPCGALHGTAEVPSHRVHVQSSFSAVDVESVHRSWGKDELGGKSASHGRQGMIGEKNAKFAFPASLPPLLESAPLDGLPAVLLRE